MKLQFERIDDTHAALYIDGSDEPVINVNGEKATAVALQVARAMNRDKHFDALVAALSPFRSSELGGLLVDMVDFREHGAEEAEKRLSRLVIMIDVILDAVEQAEDAV